MSDFVDEGERSWVDHLVDDPIDEDALYEVLYEYRKCSENQAREIIAHYLRALAKQRPLHSQRNMR